MRYFFILFISVSLLWSSNFDKIKQYYFKSYDYEQVGRYIEAIKVLTPLYKEYPNGYTLNLRFGWLFFKARKYNDALKYYKKAALLKPKALDPRLGMVQVYLATYNYTKAEIVSYELLKIDYYNFYANLYATKSLIAQKKYKIAKEIVFKMLSLYPTNVTYLVELAKIYKATSSIYLQKLYEDILILDPNNVYVRSQIGK